MEVRKENNVNIYNLSSGKSLPDWISERKRRMLQKKDVDIRRRIELIQDFEMPGVSTSIKLSRDGNYILATGIYKPRIRCYDVNNLSMKFERCFDAEAVDFEMLSDDYSKFVILQCERSIEFHVQYGKYYKTRVPKFGRDIKCHRESCDLLVAGSGSEIYRFNLSEGRFYTSYHTNASSINKIAIDEEYDIIMCGTMEGTIEAWDPRMRERIKTLDCAMSCVSDNNVIVDGFPSITSISFKGGLTMAVGTFTGQVMLYDMRSKKPLLIKDHGYGQPIKNIAFIPSEELVASMDPKCVKFWRQNTGQLYTSITSPTHLNDMCIVPNTGLVFLANEERKILSYFIPSIGPAPKWCCFLDNITEELEESKQDNVYDDYKFVTEKELHQLHLDHLIGTNMLRAYMHGYFMDARLYNKTRAIVQPEAQKELKKKMIHGKIDKERNAKKIQLKGNKDVYPLVDERFKAINENPDFKIDETADEYSRIKAVYERGKKKIKMAASKEAETTSGLLEEDKESEASSSSDDEMLDSDSSVEESANTTNKKGRIFQAVDKLRSEKTSMEEKDESLPIEERLKKQSATYKETTSITGSKVLTWTSKKAGKQKKDEEKKKHIKERAKLSRPAYRKKGYTDA